MYKLILKRLGLNLILTLLLLTLLRTSFYQYFVTGGNSLSSDMLLRALYTGAKFDLRLLLIIHLPLVVLGVLPALNPLRHIFSRSLWLIYFIAIYLGLTLFYISDFAYYAYLETRLDASILRFLYNFRTSAEMVIQTYPVGTLSVIVIFVTFMTYIYFTKLFGPVSNGPETIKKRVGLASMALCLCLIGIWGKASWYPLRWSDAFFSTNHLASHLALNPVLYFFDTLKNQGPRYDEELTRTAYPLMADYLKVDNPDIEKLNYTRNRNFTDFARKPNIVIVLLESFAWYKTGLSGNPFNPTPHFDRIANEGISFTRYYAPHGGTARSVWALLTGLPDIEINKTSSRNPLIVKQHTIVNAFKGYDKFYFIGGSASWANIRGLLSSNIPGLHIYEEGSYESPRMDVWGLSDLHLFEEANKVLSRQEKPFFAIIQTSGNHRPYNIPEDNHGFKSIEHDKKTLAQHGFRSPGDYNAMRFMDHSIGLFIDQASKSDYFKDTLFVFLADHGNMRHAKHLPAYVEKLGLTEFQSPLVFYAPGLGQQSKKIDHVASQLDVLPSIAGFVSQDFTNNTLGRNLFNLHARDDQQYAFTVTFARIPHIGLIGKDYYFTMYSDGSRKRLHRLAGDQPEENILEKEPSTGKGMEKLTRAFYETANYMRFHNPPLKSDANQ